MPKIFQLNRNVTHSVTENDPYNLYNTHLKNTIYPFSGTLIANLSVVTSMAALVTSMGNEMDVIRLSCLTAFNNRLNLKTSTTFK